MAVGGTGERPAGTGLSGAGVSRHTLRTPVQPTRSRGWSSCSGLVGARWALVGVVGAVVVVGCEHALGVVAGGQKLVLVGALLPKHIRGLSYSFS